MAVTNAIKAANSPVHSAPSSFFSLRGIFSCCYGRGPQKKSEEHPLAAGDDSDDSDEEIRANFDRIRRDQVDANGSSHTSILSHASASIVKSLQGTILESRASKSVVQGEGQSIISERSVRSGTPKSLVSAPGKSVVSENAKSVVTGYTGTAKSVVSDTGKSFVSGTGQSVVSGTGKSVVSGTGKSVVSGTGKSVVSGTGKSVISQTSMADSFVKDDGASDSSEHLSDASSETQFSDEYGDAPHGLKNLSDLSDDDVDKKEGDVRPTGRVSTLGVLSIGVQYEGKKARLTVRVREARDVPDPSQGGTTSYQLHLVLLPERRQRHKTKLRLASRLNFEESFVFTRVSPSTVGDHALRVRLYGCERRRRERLVAETVVALSTFGLQPDEKLFDIPLEPRTKLKSRKRLNSGSDTDSVLSLQGVIPHGNNLPELLVGLSYNGTTGLLSVEIIKGSAFRLSTLSRPPDSYVKMHLLSSNGQEINRSKTSIRRNDPNPLFKETFRFQMAMFQLNDLTLMVFVYHKKNISRKESIGWFSLGFNSSGDEEVTHWKDMKEALGDRIFRWHLLLEPT